jgi:hypothetical protein
VVSEGRGSRLEGRRDDGATQTTGTHRGLHWLGWLVVAVAVLEGGWLALDGGRALIVGDYFTPGSGGFAGQLGPWATVVAAVGIEPRSALMKAIHLGLGTTGLVVTAGFVSRKPWGRKGMLACALLGLWYLPFGTILSLVQVVLLQLPAVRGAGAGDHRQTARA